MDTEDEGTGGQVRKDDPVAVGLKHQAAKVDRRAQQASKTPAYEWITLCIANHTKKVT